MPKNKTVYGKEIITWFFILLLEIFLLYLYWKNNIILTAALIIVSIFILLKMSNKNEIILYFTGFFLGPIYDLVLVSTGIWTYGNPLVLGVPPWLPFAYGIGAVMIIKIGSSVRSILFD